MLRCVISNVMLRYVLLFDDLGNKLKKLLYLLVVPLDLTSTSMMNPE